MQNLLCKSGDRENYQTRTKESRRSVFPCYTRLTAAAASRKKLREVVMFRKRNLKDAIKGPAHILYHAALITVDLSLPYTVDFIARRFMIFWRQRKDFLVSLER